MAYTPYYSGGWQSGEEGGTPITPAALNNMEDGIGAALPKAGGTMTGSIYMGQSGASSAAQAIWWKTADATEIYLRPYNNKLQFVVAGQGALGINSDNTVEMAAPFNWRSAIRVFVNLSSSTMTNQQIYNALNNAIDSPGTYTATTYISGATASTLTGGKVTVARYGTVTRYASDSYRFSVTRMEGSEMNAWSTTVTKSGDNYIITPGNVYQYSGTQI